MNKLRDARFHKGITQIELFKKTGIWPARLSLIENSHVEAKKDERVKLANVLGVNKEWLFPD